MQIAQIQITLTPIPLAAQTLRSPLWVFRGNCFFRTRWRGCLWCRQAHLNLELFYQFAGLEFLGFVIDLDLLLVDIAHRHVHARFVDGSCFLNLAHHLIVRLPDPANLELLPHSAALLLPLQAPPIPTPPLPP